MGAFSTAHCVKTGVYVHGTCTDFALNDPLKRSLSAADLGIRVSSTLHSLRLRRQFTYNSNHNVQI